MSNGYRIAGLCLAAALVNAAAAQNVLEAQYDPGTDELVAEIAYRGTNPDHGFSLQWDRCKPLSGSEGPKQVAALVVDDQWDDRAVEEYRKTVRFTLDGMPCRPAKVTLHTPPGFVYTIFVPAKADG